MAKVFFIGDVALDEYYKADYFPKIKEKIIVHSMPAQMGGSMANAACVYTSLGNSAYFLTALNSGEITKKLIAGLKEAGINTDYMVYDDAIPDAKCIIILAEEEHTVFIPTLALESITLNEESFQALCESDYIYTTFCEIRPLRYQAVGESQIMRAPEIMGKIKENGVKVWCDLDCADLSEEEAALFPCADVVFVNEKGEENLQKRFGINWLDELFSMGLNMIIVTKAENGCVVYKKDRSVISVSGISVRVQDVTGAGDTFCSSFLHAYVHGADIRTCAEFANLVAARAVTGMGARYGAAGGAEIWKFIESHQKSEGQFEKLLEGC